MLPKERAIELPLIKEIAKRGGRCSPSDHLEGQTVYQALAGFFELTDEDLAEVNESDQRCKWDNMVRYTRRHLVDLRVISNSIRDVWELTDKGKKVAEFMKGFIYTPESLDQLRSIESSTQIDTYKRMINAGMDKSKALKCAGANELNDCKSILLILDED